MANPWDQDEIVGGNPWDQDEIVSDARAQAQAAPVTDLRPVEVRANPTDGMSGWDRFMAGAGKATQDAIDGVRQFGVDDFAGRAAGVEKLLRMGGMDGVANFVNRTSVAPVQAQSDQLREQHAERRRLDAPLMDTGAGTAGSVAGNVALALVPGMKVSRYAQGATLGAGFGAVQPLAEGESRAANVGIGAGAGVIGQKAGDMLAASGTKAANAIAPEVRAAYEAAKARGINLMPWQLSESAWMPRARGVAAAVPFSGAKSRTANQSAQFQAAAAREMGENLAPGESITPAVMGRAADRIGGDFDRLLANGAKLDRQFLRDVKAVRDDVQATGNDQVINAVENVIDRLRRQGGETVNGKTLQSLDRQLRTLAESGDPDRKMAGMALRKALHRVYERTAPEADAAAMKAARSQYRTLATYEPVVARNGELVPQQLLGALNSTKSGRRAMARDRGGELAELARIGQMMKPAPTSGTAENLFSGGALVGGTLNLPLTLKLLAMGNVAGRTLDSGRLAQMMLSPNRGAWRQGVGPYMLPGSLGMVPVAASAEEPPQPWP